MAEMLLIHGSCHGAWCWDRVIPALTARGHHARALDLPAPARDGTPADQVTLDSFARTICAALARPTLLIGHSMAGYAITAAAERDNSQITGLVYLCAYLPRSGASLAQMRRAGPAQPLAPALRVDAARRSFWFDPAQVADLFYHDCDAATQQAAQARLVPEPIAPQETALALTARSTALPRFYITCSEDRAIPPAYQAQMAQALPPAQVSTLPSSHAPFFACPEALADRLDALSRTKV